MLKKQEKSNNFRGNSGFSLIEVIVSLLILGIIIVPLLNMFVFSAKTNTMSREKQVITELGTNVMEEIIAEGIVDWAEKKNWDFKQGELTFDANKNENRFAITVTAAPSTHETDNGLRWNDFQMSDISKLSRSTTAIIDPFELFTGSEGADSDNVKLVETYDDMAASEFRNRHREEILRHWSDYMASLDEEMAEPPFPTEYSIEDIKRLMARSMNLVVEDSPTGGNGAVQVTCTISYELACDRDGDMAKSYHYGTNWRVYEEDAYPGYIKDTCDGKGHLREYSGFYDDVTFDALEDLFLFHTPLKGNIGSWKSDTVLVENKAFYSLKNLRLFLPSQLYSMDTGVKTNIVLEPKDGAQVYLLSDDNVHTAENQYLLSNGRKIPSYTFESVETVYYENELTEKLPKEDRLYDITVTVKEKNSDKERLRFVLEGR